VLTGTAPPRTPLLLLFDDTVARLVLPIGS
jgi:hypothetical protein